MDSLVHRTEGKETGEEEQSFPRIPKPSVGVLAKGIAGTFALRVFQTGVRFLISLVLARLLGTEGYGAYAFAITWVAVLSVPALLGFDGLIVREFARYQVGSKAALLRGILRRARQLTWLASLTLLVSAAGLTWTMSSAFERPVLITLWIGLLALPLLTEIRVVQAALIAFRRVIIAQAPEMVVQPVLFLGLIGTVALLKGTEFDAMNAIALYGASIAAAWLLATRILNRVQHEFELPSAAEFRTIAWIRDGLPFTVTTGLIILGSSLGVLMLGPMRGPAETGIFAVVAAASGLISLPLAAVNTPLAPVVATAFAQSNTAELQRLATKGARSALILCLPLALIYILAGWEVLWLFGEEFTTGHIALVILSVAQIVNVATGSVGILLQMTGHERNVAVTLAIALLVNFAVNVISIPIWGVDGAALGAAANIVVWNALLLIQVRRKLGIWPTAIRQSSLLKR